MMGVISALQATDTSPVYKLSRPFLSDDGICTPSPNLQFELGVLNFAGLVVGALLEW